MLLRLKGGKVYDPANGIDGEVRDIYVRDGRVVAKPRRAVRVDQVIDLDGCVVMPGAIDIHTHIGGGKVNVARMLLPEDHALNRRRHKPGLRSGSGEAAPTTFETGYRYSELGYTSCFEPAMLPANARHAHLEMADVPNVDCGAYALLGSDDFLLRMLADGAEDEALRDYVAWTLHATQAVAIKVVNPGGINAFKFNQRSLDLDEPNSHYGVTPRDIVRRLCGAVQALGVTHPIHLHGCNLGVPGNIETTLATVDAAEGLPLHLTHVQFHCYGKEGKYRFSSGARRLADALRAHPNISIDVGQIMFGQTVTASGDTMLQYKAHGHAHPRKWVCMDIECDAGCGVVPFRYRDANFVNALQWCIGLELFLLVEDPWRIFLTTDHPNGAPFTSYPHLIRLLMDRSFRADMLATLHPAAREASLLPGLDREYSLYEIAILTRAAPARSLGLRDKGHLGPGACADITVYRDRHNREQMFSRPTHVFKGGALIAENGVVRQSVAGAVHVVRPEFDRGIERDLRRYFDRYHSIRLDNFPLQADELLEFGRSDVVVQHCSRT